MTGPRGGFGESAGPIAVIGVGRVAEQVEVWLRDHDHPVVRLSDGSAVDPAAGVAVFASDGPALAVPSTDVDVPWLAVGVELDYAVAGPLVLPGAPGCLECAQRWRRGVAVDSPPRAWARDTGGARPALPRPLSAPVLHSLAAVAAAEAVHVVSDGGGLRTAGALVYFALAEPRIERRRLVADPACPVCGHPGPATQGAPVVRLRPRRAPASEPQVRDLVASALAAVYVDLQTGRRRVVRAASAAAFMSEEGVLAALTELAAAGDSDELGHIGFLLDDVLADPASLPDLGVPGALPTALAIPGRLTHSLPRLSTVPRQPEHARQCRSTTEHNPFPRSFP